MGIRHLYVPTVNGIPCKAFQDPKTALDWLAQSGKGFIACPDLGIVNADYPKAVQALLDGYHLTCDTRDRPNIGPITKRAVYRVEWH